RYMAEPLHHPQYAADARPDGDFIQAQRLAAFIEEDLHAAVAGALPERTFAQFRDENDRRTEGLRHLQQIGLARRDADLGQVGAMECRGVEVDAVVAPQHYLAHE